MAAMIGGGGGRRLFGPLFGGTSPLNDAANAPAINSAFPDPATVSALYFFPAAFYPLHRVNQIILGWSIKTVPTSATSIQLIPFRFETNADASGSPGWLNNTPGAVYALGEFQFDNLQTANQAQPNVYAITRTAADSTVTLSTHSFLRYTRHALPICDDYVGFRITHNGTANTGEFSLWGQLGWA